MSNDFGRMAVDGLRAESRSAKREAAGLYSCVLYVSVVLSLAVIVVLGLITGWGEWYSPDLALRHQSAALMEGRLGLADSASAIEHDQVWDNGRVQQVWGLGSPAWRVPFEAGARLFSFRPWGSSEGRRETVFPDRIAFGGSLVVIYFLVIRAFVGMAGRSDLRSWFEHVREHGEKTAAIFVLALFPPFMTLLHTGGFSVYSEVQAYSYLAGIGLLTGTLLFVRNPRFWMLLVVATLGGLAAFVRPTAGIFGVFALFVLILKAFGLGWSWWRLATGVALFVAGGALLYFSNWVRFGAGFEFGHNLNLNGLFTMRFAGRFEALYSSEPLLSAARELGSLLFFEDGYRSDTLRWRQLTFATYNLAYLFPMIVVTVWFVGRCRRIFVGRKLTFGETEVLAFWCVTSTVPLLVFYLRFPVMNSRYLLDFAPGFAAGILAFVYLLRDWGVPRFGRRFRTVLLAGVVLWWGYQVIFVTEIGRGAIWNQPIRREELLARIDRSQPDYGDMPEIYEVGTPIGGRVARHNGSGWDSYSGNTRATVALFIDDPEFLELTVGPVEVAELPAEDYGIIRAKVGLEFLELERTIPTGEGMVLRFAGPKRNRYRSGIQVAFIAFMTAEELHEGRSRFRLFRVRWLDRIESMNEYE